MCTNSSFFSIYKLDFVLIKILNEMIKEKVLSVSLVWKFKDGGSIVITGFSGTFILAFMVAFPPFEVMLISVLKSPGKRLVLLSVIVIVVVSLPDIGSIVNQAALFWISQVSSPEPLLLIVKLVSVNEEPKSIDGVEIFKM